VVRGYGSGQLESDSRGDPKIVGRIDGIKYYVYFYGCVDNRGCTSVQFVAGWKGSERYTQSKMNKWNREKRMGTAYLTEKGSARLKLPVTTKFGITRANFDETVRLWKVVMKSFQKEVAGF
jgi:hypothetical protein